MKKFDYIFWNALHLAAMRRVWRSDMTTPLLGGAVKARVGRDYPKITQVNNPLIYTAGRTESLSHSSDHLRVSSGNFHFFLNKNLFKRFLSTSC